MMMMMRCGERLVHPRNAGLVRWLSISNGSATSQLPSFVGRLEQCQQQQQHVVQQLPPTAPIVFFSKFQLSQQTQQRLAAGHVISSNHILNRDILGPYNFSNTLPVFYPPKAAHQLPAWLEEGTPTITATLQQQLVFNQVSLPSWKQQQQVENIDVEIEQHEKIMNDPLANIVVWEAMNRNERRERKDAIGRRKRF